MTVLSIHCGAHKTATKSIQAMLAEGRRTLNRRGINYIHPWTINKAVSWPDFYKEADTRSEKLLYNVFADSLKRNRARGYVRKPKRVVVSHESFLSGVRLNPGASTFYPHIETTLRKCRDRGIFDLFEKVQLVFVVRRQDHFIASLYLYQLVTGLWSEPFDRLMQRMDVSVVDWWRLASLMSEADGVSEVHIRPFEMLLESGEKHFTRELYSLLLGEDPPDLGTLQRRNEGLSELGHSLAMQAYPHLEHATRRRLGQAMRQILPVSRFGKPKLVDKALKEKILRISHESNKRLFDSFMPGFENVRQFYLEDRPLGDGHSGAKES